MIRTIFSHLTFLPELVGALSRARFIKAAKELGVDESGKAFEEAMRKLAKRKPGSN